ncbi:MAG: VanW family protein [Dethiobacteria bacterium]
MLGDFYCSHKRIYPGVHINGAAVGGLTKDEAADLLGQTAEEYKDKKIAILLPEGEELIYSLHELGIELDTGLLLEKAYQEARSGHCWNNFYARYRLWKEKTDIPLSFKFNTQALNEIFLRINKAIYQKAKDAYFIVLEDSVEIAAEKNGRMLDFKATREAILKSLPPTGEKTLIAAVIKEIRPPVTKDKLLELGINSLMASFETSYNPAQTGRAHNIALSAASLNETIILHGEEFSFLENIGEISHESGYQSAPIIVNNKIVDGVGGGVCQTSSTLYNAALLANLEISERHNHSLRVAYLPAGLDATVTQNGPDLKFINNREHALLLTAVAENGRLEIKIFGQKMKERVQISTKIVKEYALPAKYIVDPQLKPGEKVTVQNGIKGYEVSVWRNVFLNGEHLRSENISYDRYRAVPAVYRIAREETVNQQAEHVREAAAAN